MFNLDWYKKFGNHLGLKVDEKMAEVIIPGLDKREEKYGARYCPCKLDRTLDNICPCKELRVDRKCSCGLFKEK